MTQNTHDVSQRLSDLRKLMVSHGVDAYLIPSSDEHQNEYLAPHKRRREALSGFTGSAGDVVVCADSTHLFVDSRYYLQAEQEVPEGFTVHKVGLAGEVDLHGWIKAFETTTIPFKLGVDPFLLSLSQFDRLSKSLSLSTSQVVALGENLVDSVWPPRPDPPKAPVFSLPTETSGESTGEKLGRIQEGMEKKGAGALVLTRPDDIAWATNLRGGDIPCNPVFEAYLVVEKTRVVCFTDREISSEALQSVEGVVDFAPYKDFFEFLKYLALTEKMKLWLDKDSTSKGVALLATGAEILEESPNVVVGMKAIKNPVELSRMAEGHILAGAAKVRAFARLEAFLGEGGEISEAGFAEWLAGEYEALPGFWDLSFPTISGFGENGAIVHYGTPDEKKMLEPGGLLLVDSGVQLKTGATTDDTRTVVVGPPTELQQERYTQVLRAHIHLAMQIFPEGTTGTMLDAITRSSLWNQGLDFGHGTGHGVGAFLNVHEGPQGISPRNNVPLKPGMVISNEPGFYQDGWGGIRLENLYVVEEAFGLPPHMSGKKWFRLLPLTLIPFDSKLIQKNSLGEEESQWLTDYHRRVEEALAPHLEGSALQWLKKACG